jgi:predicted dehydrogenase
MPSCLTVLRVAEAADAKILVGHHRRHSAIIAKAVEVIRSGALGKIVGVVGMALFYKAESEGYFDGQFAWRREPGGGPILLNLHSPRGCLLRTRDRPNPSTMCQAFKHSRGG